MYTVSKSVSPPQITELLARRIEQPYNLKHNAEFLQQFVRRGTESILYISPKIWGMVQGTYKNINSLYNLKKVIKKWKPENCPCKICKIFIKNIRFCEIVYIYIAYK